MEEQNHLLPPPENEGLLLAKNPRPVKKYIFIGIAAGIFIGVGIAGFILAKKPTTKVQSTSNTSVATIEPRVTLYYNDGTTVLWNNENPETYSETTEPKIAPYFVNTVRGLLKQKYGEKYYTQGKWDVTTTLNKDLQQISENSIASQKDQFTKQSIDALGFVAEDVKTGQVVAMVGNLAPNEKVKDTTTNFATHPIQPGSSIKPLVYAAAIENTTNLGAGSELDDTKGPVAGYLCTRPSVLPSAGGDCLYDYDYKFVGPISLRYALATSRNVPVARLVDVIGMPKVQEVIKKLGVESGYNCFEDETLAKPSTCYASAALGEGAYLGLDEQVHAYATLSNNGIRVDHTYMLKTTLNGSIKEEWKQETGEQAMRADAAYIVDDILSDPNASYLTTTMKSVFSVSGHKISVKTGTTYDNSSGMIIGYGTKYATGFWLGNDSAAIPKIRARVTAFENLTVPLLSSWQTAALKDVPMVERPKPSGILTLNAYVNKTHVTLGSVEPSTSKDLYPSWYKQ